MIVAAVNRGAKDEELVGRILCHDVRGRDRAIVFRKGHHLRPDDLPVLAEAVWSELHLIQPGPGDLGQREAGQRLAESLSGPGLALAPSGHRHVLRARHDGLVRIDTKALQRLNAIPGIAVYTLLDGQSAAKEQIVAEAQITPLIIGREAIESVAAIADRASGIIRLVPFVPREAVLWTRDDRHLDPLTARLRWFGCRVRESIGLPGDAEAMRQSLERCAASGATLFLIAGSNALDPLDPVFAALSVVGATMQRVGMPVHPGTLLWLASWGEITIVGLPTCGLGTQVTAFDLILPKLMAEGRIDDDELAALGHGGILPFARARAWKDALQDAVEESVDEPVR
ncbi:MAG: molybdopterin biosynthesis protein [Acidobacteria bacterium]|nr:molybdopterin biosynthesis protein [Acidobacteriota bacterium]